MSSTSQCTSLNKLNPIVRALLNLALADAKKNGVNPLVVETLRTKERQYYLYGQGRTASECKSAGVPVSYASPKDSKVTWTMNSIHIQGCAVDVIPQRKIKGKMTAIWNSSDVDTKELIRSMEKFGFEAGANWSSSPDSPHFQCKGIAQKSTLLSRTNTTPYITKVIQKALGISADGSWGNATDKAVNVFRRKMKWKENGKLGAIGIKKLLG